jgi:hypothetical protein
MRVAVAGIVAGRHARRLGIRLVEDIKWHVEFLDVRQAGKAAHIAVEDRARDPAQALADVHLDVAGAHRVDDEGRAVEGRDLDRVVLAGVGCRDLNWDMLS